jgi:hypothetical protein
MLCLCPDNPKISLICAVLLISRKWHTPTLPIFCTPQCVRYVWTSLPDVDSTAYGDNTPDHYTICGQYSLMFFLHYLQILLPDVYIAYDQYPLT